MLSVITSSLAYYYFRFTLSNKEILADTVNNDTHFLNNS